MGASFAAAEPLQGLDRATDPQASVARTVAHGAVAFVGPNDTPRMCVDLDRLGILVVHVGDLDETARGHLGERVDEAVERELRGRGSAGPSVASAKDRDAALSDQLYRARRAGAVGIAVVMGSLAGMTDSSRAILPDDCAFLRFLAKAAAERPVTLVLDARDAGAGAYGDPVALRDVLTAPLATGEARGVARPRAVAPDGANVRAAAQTTEAAAALGAPAARVQGVAAETLARHVAGASVAHGEQAWRNWMLQLAAARGPQPLVALERLFADSYMPLANAIAAGLDDPRARAAHDEFRVTLTRSYSEAFPTFAATTKRPRMVLDVHDAAARIARLHGARSTRLLLVDAMRWDLSRLVAQRVAVRLGERAALTDELLLWSALPTTTMRQLETIARGVAALRAPAELDAEGEPTRGRTADYVRRLRVGPREIHKLDLVQARIHAARGTVLRALPEIAEATADVIARHAETLSPHTLLFVFGDHGFAIDRSGSVTEGGASPEEVIVGAFALLVGDVH